MEQSPGLGEVTRQCDRDLPRITGGSGMQRNATGTSRLHTRPGTINGALVLAQKTQQKPPFGPTFLAIFGHKRTRSGVHPSRAVCGHRLSGDWGTAPGAACRHTPGCCGAADFHARQPVCAAAGLWYSLGPKRHAGRPWLMPPRKERKYPNHEHVMDACFSRHCSAA